MILLSDLAHSRSGDKGDMVNIAVISYTAVGYEFLRNFLTCACIKDYLRAFGVKKIVRYDLENLLAFNFVLAQVLGDGSGSLLVTDNQGKSWGKVLLGMSLKKPRNYKKMLRGYCN